MDPDPIDGDQVYAAERLLQTRNRRGQQEFLVKWKGWNNKHNTWEPRANILDERLIQEFEQRVGSRAPKRRSVGAPPTSSGGKEAPAINTSPSVFGPPQPKRTRRAIKSPDHTKADNVSDVTSPSTSVGTRRSSRRSSAAKESREGSIVEKVKPMEAAVSESKSPKKPSPVKAHEALKKGVFLTGNSLRKFKEEVEEQQKLDPITETEPELSTEDEEKSGVDEKKATSSQEEPKPTGVEPVALEIYVKHTVKEEKIECVKEQLPAMHSGDPVENGQAQKTGVTSNNEEMVGEDAFIITNESDPATTHKIQVYTLSGNGDSNEEEQQKLAPSGSKSVPPTKTLLGEEEKEIVLINDVDHQQKSGSVVETVGSSDEGKTHVTANGQSKTAETVVATVTLDEE